MKSTSVPDSPLQLDEILVQIFCDDIVQFHDILRFERVCKLWYAVAGSGMVWRSLLSRLDDDHAPNLSPLVNINLLNAFEARELVTKAYRNCARRTSYPASSMSPIYSREISLPDLIKPDDALEETQCPNGYMTYQLLQGGDYMLVHCSVKGGLAVNFELLHVPTGKSIWTYSDRLRGNVAVPVSFTASYSKNDAGKILIASVAIMSFVKDSGICESGINASHTDGCFVLVLQLRLSTGECEVVLRTRISEPVGIEDEGNVYHALVLSDDGILVAMNYDRKQILFVDYQKSLYRWVALETHTDVQRMFTMDDALICIVDKWEEVLAVSTTNVVVIQLNDVLKDASQINSSKSKHQVLKFWDITGIHSQPIPSSYPEILRLLSVRTFRAHWRGESATHITLLVMPEDISLLAHPPESGVSVLNYIWDANHSNINAVKETCRLRFVSKEDVGGFERLVPPHNLVAFSDISQSGWCTAVSPWTNKLHAFTIDALGRQELGNKLYSFDDSILLNGPHHLDYYSDVLHYLDQNSGIVHLYYFD
ncbi:hypothetical protein SCHPADRAFT_945390 [Schizopora paradoxa]|uniref:F-box domain-containing protein n=1 Tax=Schizopora paradoxa TaxID=27342 RepID=A0A0H2R632_9AGAM|nr:hypothetical protein SCHPADRAFT_945390 [Schizopora paradoxa]